MRTSLLICGIPRTMTTVVAEACLKMLPGMKAHPKMWASEILNIDALTKFNPNPPEPEYELAKKRLLRYSRGYVIKDVNHPHLVSRFAQEYPSAFAYLIVDRPLSHTLVSYGKIPDKWAYIKKFFRNFEDAAESGMGALRKIHGVMVDQEHLAHEPNVLYMALQELGYAPNRHNYITPGFRKKRQMVMEKIHACTAGS